MTDRATVRAVAAILATAECARINGRCAHPEEHESRDPDDWLPASAFEGVAAALFGSGLILSMQAVRALAETWEQRDKERDHGIGANPDYYGDLDTCTDELKELLP